MPDQAAALRQLMRPSARPGAAERRTRVLAVASGKGGVGKTNVAINLAIALAREGRKVVLLDGDLGLANVDVLLGLTPRWTLEHVVAGERTMAEVLTAAPGGFWVIPGASGLEELANLSEERRRHLVDALVELDGRADVLLIDTAAGISTEVSQLLSAAAEVLVVTTPDPTAITDAYALVKVASQAAERRAAALGEASATTFRLVVNQAQDVGEAGVVARKITTVAREFLGVDLEMLGYVPFDRSLARAVRRQVPLMLAYPSSPAALRFVELARRLVLGRSPVKESESAIINLLRRMAVPRGLAVASRGLGDAGV